MDDHERAMWERMLERTFDFDGGTEALGKLVADLRGLYVEADPQDPTIRDGFETWWSAIDGQHELRTEAWSRPEWAGDERLAAVVEDFRRWVRSVLAADTAQS